MEETLKIDIYGRYIGLIDFIVGRYKRVVEIGIGKFPYIAYSLLEKGINIFATDIYPIRFGRIKVIIDDVTSPDISLYRGVDLLYSIKPPPELVPYMVALAYDVSAELIVKPLYSDYLDGQITYYKSTAFFLWEKT